MYDKLNMVIAESGIWEDNRAESHAFRLSPSVYGITKAQEDELSSLGIALYDYLMGLSHIAVIAYDRELNYGGVWAFVRKVFSTGVPKAYLELQGLNVKHVPRLLKVDFMLDASGSFKIAEIDGHNKHGLGYSTLGMRFRQALMPDARVLPGAVSTLASEVKRLGYDTLKLFYADQERFYIPEFEVAAQEFAQHGVNCLVVSEMEADAAFVDEGLFLDLPFLYHKPDLYESIIQGYLRGSVEFIIPPKPFLGSKGVLALLRNDIKDEQLEALLLTFIRKQSLELVRGYIPETLLVGKHATRSKKVLELVSHKRYVLKEAISSGMKGTVFSDDLSFEKVLREACEMHVNWILQEEVVNQPQIFSWYENGSNCAPRLHTSEDWFMRVTTQYINRKLGDVIVTARQDKAVHGAKDCIQIGTIVL